MKAAGGNHQERSIRILIADDHPTIRRMVCVTLEQHPGFHVCHEARDGAEAVEVARRLKPDVAVLNVTMPVMSGLEAAKLIVADSPEIAIVILSAHIDDGFLKEARKIGARAYIDKTCVARKLIETVEAALAGDEDFLVAV